LEGHRIEKEIDKYNNYHIIMYGCFFLLYSLIYFLFHKLIRFKEEAHVGSGVIIESENLYKEIIFDYLKEYYENTCDEMRAIK
jgi:hypothetical protein